MIRILETARKFHRVEYVNTLASTSLFKNCFTPANLINLKSLLTVLETLQRFVAVTGKHFAMMIQYVCWFCNTEGIASWENSSRNCIPRRVTKISLLISEILFLSNVGKLLMQNNFILQVFHYEIIHQIGRQIIFRRKHLVIRNGI